MIKYVFGFVLFASAFLGFAIGVSNSLNRCDDFGTKRYHYLFPTSVYTCMTVRWLNNEEFISDYDWDIKYGSKRNELK